MSQSSRNPLRTVPDFRDEDEARAWVAFYCAVRPLDVDWEKQADVMLEEYRERRAKTAPDPIALVNAVAAAPYFSFRLTAKGPGGEDMRAMLQAILDALKTGKVGEV